MGIINLEEQEFWDHYSGLPNPSWYKYKKELTDEEDSFNTSIPLGGTNPKVKTQEEKYMGSIIKDFHE